MTIAFVKDQNDDRTPDGLNRHGFPQPSLETAKCLASVFADLEELDGLDMDRAERTKQVLLKREKAVVAELKREAGFDIEIWAAASLTKAFDKLGLHALPLTYVNHRAVLGANPERLRALVADARRSPSRSVQGS